MAVPVTPHLSRSNWSKVENQMNKNGHNCHRNNHNKNDQNLKYCKQPHHSCVANLQEDAFACVMQQNVNIEEISSSNP
ncbi:hypothetical protein T11_8535 [Trichinella zimbabwensis]|uniref:Uncharacterized protein n=1 Tax=Trichinella zimbabwensis TaxID=268475 RepID=A0A0V1HK75_9BILA|nr:hypothetical protein T11_8535 [Trichinella zimbabwensis]